MKEHLNNLAEKALNTPLLVNPTYRRLIRYPLALYCYLTGQSAKELIKEGK
jgi:hypothetical protein